MSHEVNSYFHNSIIQGGWGNNDLRNYYLTANDENKLSHALVNDIKKYYYSSIVSIANAFHDINSGFFSWAIVELFYSVFYLNRVLAGLNKNAFFYYGKTPFRITVISSKAPEQKSGNTHDVIINDAIVSNYFRPLRGQLIDSLEPLRWFEEERNKVNYKNAKFIDPIIPDIFVNAMHNGLRKSITSYINENTYLYTFDKDHAVLALPIDLLKFVKKEASIQGIDLLIGEEKDTLRNMIKDKAGIITDVVSII